MSSQFVNKKSKELTNHIMASLQDQLPQVANWAVELLKEYQEVLAADGVYSAVLSAYKMIDDLNEGAFANEQRSISCKTCNTPYCCHTNVETCDAEVKLIALYCKENKIKVNKKYLQQQLMHRREDIGRSNCSACVFLKENKCSIYPVRPAGCRIHHVITPAEYCEPGNNKSNEIAMLTSTPAQIVKSVIFDQGSKTDRMPRLLLKYSQ